MPGVGLKPFAAASGSLRRGGLLYPHFVCSDLQRHERLGLAEHGFEAGDQGIVDRATFTGEDKGAF